MTEAALLWYHRAMILLESIGAIELKIARAVFVFRDSRKDGLAGLVAILSLYVDDGLPLGDPRDPRFKDVKRNVDSIFNIQHWKALGLRAEKYLGMQWQTVRSIVASLYIHMDECIDGVKEYGYHISE